MRWQNVLRFMLPRNLARRFARPVRMWPRRLRNKWVGITPSAHSSHGSAWPHFYS